MATFTATMSGDSRYSIKLELVYQSYDSVNDTAIYTYSLTATKSSGYGYWTTNTNNPVRVTVDGTNIVNTSQSYDFDTSPYDRAKTITLASGTVAIAYNGNTTRTVNVSGYFSDANNSLGSATASGTITLPTQSGGGGGSGDYDTAIYFKVNGTWILIAGVETLT